MRCLIIFTILACALALVWSAAVNQPEQEAVDQPEQEAVNQPEHETAKTLLDVDSAGEHSNEGVRQARHLLGYYSRPIYAGYVGYGGYGGYYRPYYGGYGQPYGYYGAYGGF